MFQNYVTPAVEFPELDEEERNEWKRKLIIHSIGVPIGTVATIGCGVLFSLHSYNELVKIDRMDRLGKIMETYSGKQMARRLFLVRISKVLTCSNLKIMLLRHVPGCVSNAFVNKSVDISYYLLTQFVGTLVSFPFEHILHRCLFSKEIKKDWSAKSYWKSFLFRFVGKVVGDATGYIVTKILTKIFKYGMKAKKKIFKRNDRLDRRIKDVYKLIVVRFLTRLSRYYTTNPFNTKSFAIQIGMLKTETSFFDFSDLPKRKNMFNVSVANTSMRLFQELVETYIFYGILQFFKSAAVLYKDNICYTAHHFLQFLKDSGGEGEILIDDLD